MKLHIVAPDIRAGDAVGNHCLYLADALPAHGFPVAMYAQRHNIDEGGRILDVSRLLTDEPPAEGDLILLSFSTFQPRLAALMDLPCRKIAYFHGVTPVELLLEHDPAAAYWSSRALLQLPMLAGCEHLIANSQWNLAELIRHLPAGSVIPDTSVIPPITPDMPLLGRTPRAQKTPTTPLRVLIVGRMAPHKRVEDGIRMAAQLRALGVPTEVDIVGSTTSPDYLSFLQSVVNSLDIGQSVHFHGHVSDDTLSRCFLDADVLLTCSMHEGFCIPVLEAMQLGVPNLLRRGTAASEVASGACAEFSTVDEGARELMELATNSTRRAHLNAAGQARAKELIRESDVLRLVAIVHER